MSDEWSANVRLYPPSMGCRTDPPQCAVCEQQKRAISPERALAYEQALMLIEGGDYPSDDATALRTIAYRALMGLHPVGDE